MSKGLQKVWTKAEMHLVGCHYIDHRRNGLGMGKARISAQTACIPRDHCYSESSMMRNQLPHAYQEIFDGAEQLFRNEKATTKAYHGPIPAHSKPAGVEIEIDVEKPVEEEQPTPADYMVLAMRAMEESLEAKMKAQFTQLLDLLTTPEGGKQAVEEVLLAKLEPKQRLPKLVLVGLLNAQMHVVNAKLGHKFRVVNFTSEQTGSASMVASMKGADLVVTFANMVGHHVDDLAMKYAKHWFPHHGGLTRLIEKILSVKL